METSNTVRHFRRLAAVGILALVLSVPHRAKAQNAEAPSARALFESGTAKYNLSDWKGALTDFKAAYLIKHDPVFLFNIAQCFRQLNDYTNAALEYRAYLREAPDAPNREDVQRLVGDMEAAMQRQSATQPPTGIAQPKEETPSAQHTAPTTVPTPQPQPGGGAATEDSGRAKRLAGIGLMAGGGAALVLGGVFVGLAKAANDAAGATGTYDPGAISKRNGYEVGDAICFAVGGAAAATGILLFVLGRKERERPTALNVAPVVSTTFAGASMTGRF